MTLIDLIESLRVKVRKYQREIDDCPKTSAGYIRKRELQEESRELYCTLGQLVSNESVFICLR